MLDEYTEETCVQFHFYLLFDLLSNLRIVNFHIIFMLYRLYQIDKGKNNTAILEKKKSPIRLIVDEAINGDNSVVSMNLNRYRICVVAKIEQCLIMGKKRRDTICIALADDTCDEPKIKMNKVVRLNLRVRLGNIISVHQCQYVSCEFFFLLLFDKLHITATLLLNLKLRKPILQSIVLLLLTQIFCEGEPVKREYEDRLDEVGYDDVGGARKLMAQIRELVELPLRHPQLFKSIGVKPPKGILFYGPPVERRIVSQLLTLMNGLKHRSLGGSLNPY
ncbi:unnamed protein product [Musa acuminata subsp. malaccensis]|uniref:(wild Malaysian banana) hypothetical protein n=1 Tax=Musa acuminata subsp. malaccensis TaxID=214687 RepID=A0A804J3Y4_MUSAM|nr:unnamed protein product [Musa acuminata subsp. malaccensis]